jgi:hypothetical protein
MEPHKNRTTNRTPTHVQKIKKMHTERKSIREIASALDIPRSTVHDILTRELSEKKHSGSSGHPSKFEIHSYQVGLKILEAPPRWCPSVILKLKKLRFEPAPRNGWTEFVFPYRDYSIHLTPMSVLIFPPKIQSLISAKDAKALATQMALDVVPKLERLLEIKLSSRPAIFMSVGRQHMAYEQDAIFDEFKKIGFRALRDYNGCMRLHLDQSKGHKHIEATHVVFASDDIDNLHGFLLEVMEGRYTLSEMTQSIKANQRAIGQLQRALLPDFHGSQSSVHRELPSYIG